MRIETLPSDVISQIAAGEVVERPAHMVKELVENSLDAKASEIEIHIQQGGRRLEIKDNGTGILKEDLEKALLLHTTSKIKKVDDLWALMSFGFRGEALSSISSVSHIQIVSKAQSQETAYKINCNFGKVSDIQETSSENGTKILIEELFQNVPARLKFLKADTTEVYYIKNTLKAMALSHPHITFRIKQNGKLLFYWPEQEQAEKRVEDILGVKKVYQNEVSSGKNSCQIFITAPNETAKNNRSLFLFAQNRWIQDRTMMGAILEAHRGLLMHGEYPSGCVFLNLDPQDIDVNIHPTKSQVRFKNASDVFRSVRMTARELLEKTPWLDSLNSTSSQETKKQDFNSNPSFQNTFSQTTFKKTHFPQKLENSYQNEETVKKEDFFTYFKESQNKSFESGASSLREPTKDFDTSKTWSQLQVLAQAQLTYIIAQNQKGLVLVDQHAAHERVLYETLLESYRNKKFEMQNFLLPLPFQKEPTTLDAIESYTDKLENLGLIVQRAGPDFLNVEAASCLLSEKAIFSCLEKLASDLIEEKENFSLEKHIEHLIATMACHSAIRAGKVMSFKEMQSLLEKMDLYPLSCFCPHGRPVYIEYSFSQLEKDFKRRV